MKKESYKTRLRLTALTALSIGALFGSCNDEFDEVLGICPEVESTNPEHEAIGIQLNNAITVTFNEDMNPATILPGVFSLRVNNTSTSGAARIANSEEIGDQLSGDLTFEEGTNKMTFIPHADLLPNTTYTGRVEPVVKDMVGNALQTAYVWTFTTGVSPTVISTNPANLATGTPLDQMITATFSTAMDSLTITGATYKLMAGTTPVEGEVVYSGSTASFNPTNDLLAGTKYTGVVTIEAKNKDGIPLAIAYNWTFDTGTAPTVKAIDPKDLETGVPANKTIKVTFSEPMNPGTITNTSFTVKTGTEPVAGTVTYSDSTAVFTPKASLISNTIYSVSISKSVKSPAGVPMANDFASKFTTGNFSIPEVSTTDPADKATGVAITKMIMATFSEAMDPASLTGTTFTLKQGNTAVAGTVSYNENKATFTPAKPLSANLVYTGTITTGAKNAAGTGLPKNFIWTFTTAANVAPTVLSTDPADKATNIAVGKVAIATFSEAMDPKTLTGTTFTLKQGNTAVAGTVSFSGTKATFTPSKPLSGSLVYTGTITTGAKNAAGTALASNFVWTFTTAANVAPTVISTDPADKQTNVAHNKAAIATFSEAMDPATLTATTFTVKQGNMAVAGKVTYSGTKATFTPTNLLSGNLVYTGTITTGAKNAAGTALASNYVWTFTTAPNVAPTVLSTDPADKATNVAHDKAAIATFSEAMDPATLTGTTFTVKQGNTAVAGAVTYSGTKATFTPTNPLSGNLVYTGTITTGAKNAAGTALANNFVWTFTTAPNIAPTVLSTDPANNATDVELDKVATATFSEAMDPASLTATTFTVKQGNTVVAGNVSYSGTTAKFTPNLPLLPNLDYTGTITTGAKNVKGTGLANDHVWTFTTVAPIAPMVVSTDPLNNATNVARDKVVKANFSIPMDPASINDLTFTLQQGGANVAGTVSYIGTTASFTPASLLSANQSYTATITTGAKSVAGTELANDFVWNFRIENPISPYFVDLKSAERFGIFAATGISNNAGFSKISDLDVGITPGARSSVTGFPPAIIENGAIFASDDVSPPGVAAMLNQTKLDLTEAYLFAEGATTPAPATVAGDQGGKTLAPGIYKSNSTLLVQAGDLTLDAQGDPNAVWIFQIASSFTTVGGAGGNIILSGGAQAKNIFWQVGSSATIGDNTQFKGNVLAFTSITMNSGATIVGRMLVLNGAVVMTNTNIIERP